MAIVLSKMQQGCKFVSIYLQQKIENMSHNHSFSSNNLADSSKLSKVLVISILVNLLYVAIEAFMGISENSLGLLSDAGHNLGDVFSLVLTLLAVKLTVIPPSPRFTYGYKKSTILVSVLNSLLLLAAVVVIVIESIGKISNPVPVNGIAVSWTAAVGIIINGLTAWILMKHQKNDINVRGAFMHMLADTLVSLGVLFSGILINITGWNIIDAIISLSVSAIILFSTIKLLHEGLVLIVDGVPLSLDVDRVKNQILNVDGVEDIHDIHIWAISTTENAMTVKAAVEDLSLMDKIKTQIREEMTKESIRYCTIEILTENSKE